MAVPGYESYMARTRRVTAAACLLELSGFMERHYTVDLAYTGAALPETQCQSDLSSHYTFSLVDDKLTQRTYTIQAAPIGNQANDACGTLGIDQAGTKTYKDGANSCWQ
ncbi:MAG: pilus assembly protein PilE [Azoarcus sp.]|nr:pilus assembly protein PilE [Azoarcus sp.]